MDLVPFDHLRWRLLDWNLLTNGCPIQSGLLMEDPDTKYGLRSDAIIAVLSANVEAWLCKHVIMAVRMS